MQASHWGMWQMFGKWRMDWCGSEVMVWTRGRNQEKGMNKTLELNVIQYAQDLLIPGHSVPWWILLLPLMECRKGTSKNGWYRQMRPQISTCLVWRHDVLVQPISNAIGNAKLPKPTDPNVYLHNKTRDGQTWTRGHGWFRNYYYISYKSLIISIGLLYTEVQASYSLHVLWDLYDLIYWGCLLVMRTSCPKNLCCSEIPDVIDT